MRRLAEWFARASDEEPDDRTAARGEHPKVVQERLGHSSIKMTLDRYSHVSASMQREAADRLDRALEATPEPEEEAAGEPR